MEDIKESIGYQLAILERLVEELDAHKKDSAASYAAINKRLQTIEDELSMYKTIIKTLKFVVVAVVSVVTFKWSGVVDAWQVFSGVK